jgi:UDP-3-O-[3-hydroxymyristoyl] glucosamine N-acyltransferase
MNTINEIAKIINGKVIGKGDIKINRLSPISLSKEGDITFAADEEHLEKAMSSNASCVLTNIEAKDYPKTVLRVEDIKTAMVILYNVMEQLKPKPVGEIHPTASVAETCKIGSNVSIGANVVLGENTKVGDSTTIEANCVISRDTQIGEGVHLYPNVTLYNNTVINNKVTIHSGTTIGAEGFGYIPKDGTLYKVPQLGRVIIEDNVEIGANSCVDRGAFSDTVIGEGSKIDNLVQIAHNVKLGRNVIVAALSGIAGSATVGDGTMMGGNVGISDHAKVGKNVKLAAKAGAVGKVKDDEILLGYPARNPNDHKKLNGLNSLFVRHYKQLKKFLRALPPEEEK